MSLEKAYVSTVIDQLIALYNSNPEQFDLYACCNNKTYYVLWNPQKTSNGILDRDAPRQAIVITLEYGRESTTTFKVMYWDSKSNKTPTNISSLRNDSYGYSFSGKTEYEISWFDFLDSNHRKFRFFKQRNELKDVYAKKKQLDENLDMLFPYRHDNKLIKDK